MVAKMSRLSSNFIPPSTWYDRFLLLLLGLPTLSLVFPLPTLIPLGLLVFLGAVIGGQRWIFLPAALALALVYSAPHLFPATLWRLPLPSLLVAALVALFFCAILPPLRSSLEWLKRGDFDLISKLGILATSLLASAGFLAWAAGTNNLAGGHGMATELEGIPRWFLFLLGVPFFAMLNACVEETIFRGFLQSLLARRFPSHLSLVLVAQASVFAAIHCAAGSPGGWIGYGITFLYGLALGHLRRRTQGILAPVLAHLATDLVIGFTLVLLAG
jgi:membrane protease YdiL (CAAX protease family)